MGKKKDKQAARAAAAAAQNGGAANGGSRGAANGKAAAATISFAEIDRDPVGFLVAPEVCGGVHSLAAAGDADAAQQQQQQQQHTACTCRHRPPPAAAGTLARAHQRTTHPPHQNHTTTTTPAQTSAKFFADCWERKPCVFKATPKRAALAATLTTLPSLLSWIKTHEAQEGCLSPLMFGRDVNAARYRDGERETPNGAAEAGSEELRVLHDEGGCTLQVRACCGGGVCRGEMRAVVCIVCRWLLVSN